MYREVVILVVGCVLFASAHEHGAPKSACENHGIPSHGDNVPQPLATNPYSVIASSANYSPGSEVTLTVTGDDFMGFYFEAVDKVTNLPIGSWEQNEISHPITECSAVTHNEHSPKPIVIMKWKADENSKSGEIVIRGTVVKSYNTYWVGIIATH